MRSFADSLEINTAKFLTTNAHIHVPAGTVPKDGPSAGIALCIAIISAFKNNPAKQNVAMTGEITLNGKVLPIGGLKEKLLAAIRYGIKKVLIPEKNKGAFSELPVTIKRKIDVIFVSHLEDAVVHCFNLTNLSTENNLKTELNINEQVSKENLSVA